MELKYLSNQIAAFYTLTKEQRELIIPAIFEGLQSFVEEFSKLRRLKTDKNFISRMRSSYVNTSISEVVEANPKLNMKASEGRSGFYYYTVITDVKRNINILVSNLPNKTHIFNPSGYRYYFASYNIERMFADGFTNEQIGINIEVSGSQMSLFTESEYLPFGLVLCYDGKLGNDTKVFEGALQPSQEEWLFKLDVTDYKSLPSNIKTINRVSNDGLTLEFNEEALNGEDEIIPLKLK